MPAQKLAEWKWIQIAKCQQNLISTSGAITKTSVVNAYTNAFHVRVGSGVSGCYSLRYGEFL